MIVDGDCEVDDGLLHSNNHKSKKKNYADIVKGNPVINDNCKNSGYKVPEKRKVRMKKFQSSVTSVKRKF